MSTNKKWIISVIVALITIALISIGTEAYLSFERNLVALVLGFVFFVLMIRVVIGLFPHAKRQYHDEMKKAEIKAESEATCQYAMANSIKRVVSEAHQSVIADAHGVNGKTQADPSPEYESYTCQGCGAVGKKETNKQLICEYCGLVIK